MQNNFMQKDMAKKYINNLIKCYLDSLNLIEYETILPQ